jgi:hypothetical protein
LLTNSQQSLLSVFREYLMGPGEMLCFTGPTLAQHREALSQLTAQGLLVKEKFRGGYSLTREGFEAMSAVADS